MKNDTTHWYKQFWPWFLILLPGCAVVASIITIMIANKDNDGLVVDDYYKAGLAINQTMERKQRARELGLQAQFNYANTLITLRLGARDNTEIKDIAALKLNFIHPTQRRYDITVPLKHAGDGQFIGQLEKLPAANWYLQLEPAGRKNKSWRIDARIQLDALSQLNNYKLTAR